MMRALGTVALVLAATPPCALQAAPIIFTGSGTVDRSVGRLTATGAVPIGSSLRFSFTFDPANATLFEADDQEAFYDVPITGFQGSLGSHPLSLDPDPRFGPVVSIGRGFSFFGGNGTEPSLSFAFYLPRALTTAADPTAPFVVSPGSRETLALFATFRSNGSTSLGIDQLMNPRDAAQLTFAYSANDPVRRASGALQGSFTGQFASISAVPEAASWAMMIGGFGVVGGTMRRRKAKVATLA